MNNDAIDDLEHDITINRLMHHPAYTKCRYRQTVRGCLQLILAMILISGAGIGTLNGAPLILGLTLGIATILILTAIKNVLDSRKKPTDVSEGTVIGKTKTSMLSGARADEGSTGYEHMRHRIEWMFKIERPDGSVVYAHRIEAFMSVTHDIKDEDIPNGMKAITFRLRKKDCCVFTPDRGDMPEKYGADSTVEENTGIPDLSVEQEGGPDL